MSFTLPRIAITLGCLVLCACTAPPAPESAAMPATATGPTAGASTPSPAPEPRPGQAEGSGNNNKSAGAAGSIAGAIRIGTRAAPAMRVCAMAVSGSDHYCTAATAGAAQYRIDGVPAGRYHLVGWIRDGDLKLLAHADIVRCVMPPCPPDELRVVEVAEGQAVTGIDLSAPYADLPDGWPGEPAGR